MIENLFTSFLIFICPVLVTANEADIQKISIKITQSGWGYKEESYEIKKSDYSFVLNGNSISSTPVATLSYLIEQPVIPALDLVNLGINKDWVKANESVFLSGLSPAEQRALKNELRNQALIEASVRGYFKSMWTDDAATVTLKIEAASGTTTLKSVSQKSFMLPWTIEGARGKQVTWDSRLGKAVAELLPNGALNRERIGGDRLASEVTRALHHESRDFLNQIKSEEEFGSELKKIRSKFKIEKSSVASMLGLGFETDGLHADLSGAGMPEGMHLDIHLHKNNNTLPGLSSFFVMAPEYIKIVSNVQWLMDLLKRDKWSRVEINMVDDVSFTDKARGILVPELRKKRPKLLTKIEPMLKKSVLLTIHERQKHYSRWIALPDGRMLLWHATGTPILNWKPNQLPKPWETFGQDAYCVLVGLDGKVDAASE